MNNKILLFCNPWWINKSKQWSSIAANSTKKGSKTLHISLQKYKLLLWGIPTKRKKKYDKPKQLQRWNQQNETMGNFSKIWFLLTKTFKKEKKKERWKENLKIKSDLIYMPNNCKVCTLSGSHFKQSVCVCVWQTIRKIRNLIMWY